MARLRSSGWKAGSCRCEPLQVRNSDSPLLVSHVSGTGCGNVVAEGTGDRAGASGEPAAGDAIEVEFDDVLTLTNVDLTGYARDLSTQIEGM